ncbi:MAG: 4-(cytidine 5'-diphospho)-2-C-methyl-D-erythritol kinase [Bacteroidota bacterium]
MIAFPNAKINLGLHVLGKRDDGFHDIETVFYPVSMCDSLEITPSGDGKTSLRQYGPALSGGENLCLKAYHLLREEYDLPPVEIHLLKHVPAGAGLGGGSSDAAFTFKMLNEMFALNISTGELEKLAAKIGSDCAFFIRNKPAFAYGRGEQLENIGLDLSEKHIRIIKPDVHVSTPEAYKMLRPDANRPSLREIIQQPIVKWKDILVNDFEKPIFKRYPEIRKIKESMYEKGALYASMSGSGSAVFGIFD